MARTTIGEVLCPVCGKPMEETGSELLCNLHEFRGKCVASHE
jgi:hypothetical protein